jgi:hypothetical protein
MQKKLQILPNVNESIIIKTETQDFMFCIFRDTLLEYHIYLHISVTTLTIAVGSKFHCTKCLWCADRMQIYTYPYWFEFVCNGKYVYVLFYCMVGL